MLRIVLALTNLPRKGKSKEFKWGPEAQEAFNRLKDAFSKEPVVKHFDRELQIDIHTDSFGAAISDIISQPHDGQLHPVAFWSCKCLPAEYNYDIHDRELLAIIESLKHWRIMVKEPSIRSRLCRYSHRYTYPKASIAHAAPGIIVTASQQQCRT